MLTEPGGSHVNRVPPPPPPPPPPHASTPTEEGVIDGGAVLAARPYSDSQWTDVRVAWWVHTAGAVCVFPIYALVTLTIWQAPSRQSLGRRLLWSTMLVLGAAVVIGIPAYVVFSRRWYWLYRSRLAPADAGVGASPPVAGRSYFEAVAVAGAAFADRVAERTRAATRPVERPRTESSPTEGWPEPWGSLLHEAGYAAHRIQAARLRSTGPAASAVEQAEQEAVAAHAAAVDGANRALEIERTHRNMGADRLQARLAELERRDDRGDDWDAARQSLREQLAAAQRMAATVSQLEGQLHRIAAQLGEAAARAEELALCPPGAEPTLDGLTGSVDRLASIRHGLQQVADVSPLSHPD